MSKETAIEALAEHIDCAVHEIEECSYKHYGDMLIVKGPDGSEYAVGDEEQSYNACKEYIEQSLWAFSSEFLSKMTGIDSVVFDRLSELCEGANDAILSIIKATCGLEDFVLEADIEDGRGNFLATYDGEEIDLGNDNYAYWIN